MNLVTQKKQFVGKRRVRLDILPSRSIATFLQLLFYFWFIFFHQQGIISLVSYNTLYLNT